MQMANQMKTLEQVYDLREIPRPVNFPYYIFASKAGSAKNWSVYTSYSKQDAITGVLINLRQEQLDGEKRQQWIGVGIDENDAIREGLRNYLNKGFVMYEDSEIHSLALTSFEFNHDAISYLERAGISTNIFFISHPIYSFPFLLGEFTKDGQKIYIPQVMTENVKESSEKIFNEMMTQLYLYIKGKPLFSLIELNADLQIRMENAPAIEVIRTSHTQKWEELVNLAKEKNLAGNTTVDHLSMVNLVLPEISEDNRNLYRHYHLSFSNPLTKMELSNKQSMIYHESSKIQRIHKAEDFIFAPYKIDTELFNIIKQGVKEIPFPLTRYMLPNTDGKKEKVSLEELILKRRSNKPRSDVPISLEDLSHLLQFSYGVTGTVRDKKYQVDLPVRAAPSGGGLYPIDLYFLSRNIEGVEKGIYYYNPHEHSINKVLDLENEEYLSFIGGASQSELKASSIMFLLVGNFPRNQWKYRERGYRIVHLDCGHLSQTLLLNAVNLQMVAKPIMGFVDDYFNELLNINGIDESVLCLMNVSYQKEGSKEQ
jgi:SagB-type dehydrogenase family enzyme